jgi:hypothetical protein
MHTIRDIAEEVTEPSKDRRKPLLSLSRDQVFLRICGEDHPVLQETTIHFVVRRIDVGDKNANRAALCEFCMCQEW